MECLLSARPCASHWGPVVNNQAAVRSAHAFCVLRYKPPKDYGKLKRDLWGTASHPPPGSGPQCDVAASSSQSPCRLPEAHGGAFVIGDFAQTFQDSCALTASLPGGVLLATSAPSPLRAALGPAVDTSVLTMGLLGDTGWVLGHIHCLGQLYKLPQTTEMCFLTFLEARGLKSRSGQGHHLSEGSKGRLFIAFSSFWWLPRS